MKKNKNSDNYPKISYTLRRFNLDDVDSLTKNANNKNIAKWLTNEFPHPYSKEDAETFIKKVSKETPLSTFAIEINNEVVGSIGIYPQNDVDEDNSDISTGTRANQAELGYWLAEKYWNKGIMTSAIKKIVGYGFNTLKVDYIFSTPFLSNIASQKVLKKLGFISDFKPIQITKNNEIYEVFIFSLYDNLIEES